MNRFYRPTYLEIDLSAIEHNYKTLRKISSHNFFCPMIKSNAYGHGAVPIAERLNLLGCDNYGVALIEEGIQLRKFALLKNQKIFVFGLFNENQIEVLIQHRLTPIISQWKQLEDLKNFLAKKSNLKEFSIHIKFDTGMNRLGFEVEDVNNIIKFLDDNPKIKVTGLCSHLFNAEDLVSSHGFSEIQLKKFNEISSSFDSSIEKHFFNSSGLLSSYYRNHHSHDSYGCRPGLSLYGIHPDLLWPQPKKAPTTLSLRPAMGLYSQIVALNAAQKGETVSYGGTWKAKKDSIIGIVPIGYADGYSRSLSNKGYMGVLGQKAPVVGSVTMDYTMIDLTDIVQAGKNILGERVTIFEGNGVHSVKILADLAGTIPYELITCIGRRVPRKYIK